MNQKPAQLLREGLKIMLGRRTSSKSPAVRRGCRSSGGVVSKIFALIDETIRKEVDQRFTDRMEAGRLLGRSSSVRKPSM
jgi:hypothetical protein